MSSELPLSVQCRRAGWLVWLTLFVSVSIAVVVSIAQGKERSVTPAYCSAVTNWFAGEPLYSFQGQGFLYLPQAALVFAPWAMLPHTACEIIWRLSIIGILAMSVAKLTTLLNGDGRWFLVNSIASTVMAYGCARNGQSTLMITGLMILSVTEICEKRWWRAAVLLSLAMAFKPLAIVLVMLAAALYRPMSWRLAIGMLIVAVAPFATQRPDYVMAQYRDCMQNLQITFNLGESIKWAQLFGMLSVAGIEFPSVVRTGIRLLAAVTALGLCWSAMRRLPPQRSAFYLFSFAACYIMLFNSRTEGNTYAMVGPVYGALIADAMFHWKNRNSSNWLISAVVLSVLNYELAILVTSRSDAIWISPLVCTAVTVYLTRLLIDEILSGGTNLSGNTDDISHAPHSTENRAAA